MTRSEQFVPGKPLTRSFLGRLVTVLVMAPAVVFAESEVHLMDEYLQLAAETSPFSGSVLVARKGRVLLQSGYGLSNRELGVENTDESKFRIGSLTKTFTALAILQLQEQGKLSLSDPISKYLPHFPRGQEIELSHLLNHSSGIEGTWRPEWHEKRDLSLDEVIAIFQSKPLIFDPGTKEEYSNPGYALLARVIEVVSGRSYDEYLQEHVYAPAKMNHTGTDYTQRVLPDRASGYVIGADPEGHAVFANAEFLQTSSLLGQASMYSTVGDLYLYDRALLGRSLLNQKSRDFLFETDEASEFTFGCWLKNDESRFGKLLYFSGISSGFEAVMYRYTDQDITIIVLANHQSAGVYGIANSLSAILAGEDYHLPRLRHEVTLDPHLLRSMVGDYQLETGDDFQIVDEEGRLFVGSHGDPLEEIFPETPESYFSKIHDLQLRFVSAADGSVESVVWTYRGEDTSGHRVEP